MSRIRVLDKDDYYDQLGRLVARDYFGGQQESHFKLGLLQFLAKYKSAENKDFKEILLKDQRQVNSRCHWIFENQEKEKKRIAIQIQQEKHPQSRNAINMHEFKGHNTVFFKPQNLIVPVQPDKKLIIPENTSFSSSRQFKEPKPSKLRILGKANRQPSIDLQSIDLQSKQEIYRLPSIPSRDIALDRLTRSISTNKQRKSVSESMCKLISQLSPMVSVKRQTPRNSQSRNV